MDLKKILQEGQILYSKLRKKTIVEEYTPQITPAHVVVQSFSNKCTAYYGSRKEPPTYFAKQPAMLSEIKRIIPFIEYSLNPYSTIDPREKPEDILQQGLAQLRNKRRDTSLIAEVMLTETALSGCTYTIYEPETLPRYIKEFAQATTYPLIAKQLSLGEWEEPSTETLEALEQRLFS